MAMDIEVLNVAGMVALFVAKNAAMPAGKTTTDTVTFQDLIDLGIIADPNA